MMVSLLAWPLALGLLCAGAMLLRRQHRLADSSAYGLWAGGACAAGLAMLGVASQALGAGVWIETLLAVPVFIAAAALQAGLFVTRPGARGPTSLAAPVAPPQWPALLCVLTIAATVALAMQEPDDHRRGVCGLLAVHMVIAARLAWRRCGELEPPLAMPMLLLVPALAAMTAALLLDQPYRFEIALTAATFIALLVAWLVLVQQAMPQAGPAGTGRAPRAVHEVLVRHFSHEVAPAVVLLRFGLTVHRADEGATDAIEPVVHEWAMARTAQVLRQHFRAEDRIVRDADGQWTVVCADVEPARASGLADRIAQQIAAQRFAEAPGGAVQLTLSAGISVRCETLADSESAWQKAGQALREAKVATLGNGSIAI